MKIIQRAAFWWSSDVAEKLSRVGLDCADPSPREEFVVVELSESDSRWPAVRQILNEFGIDTTVSTRFDRGELRSAAWLVMRASWHHDYPMPDEDFGYLAKTYDLAEYCATCGVEAKQKAPFRMRKEPKWGRRGILQLNWVFDEYFVRPEVWETVFLPFGIGSSPVLANRTGKELETVVQLRAQGIINGNLNLGDHALEVCSSCGRRKYRAWTRGEFPMLGDQDRHGLHMLKIEQWFGSGGCAYRPVIVSQELYSRITTCAVRGVDFYVTAANG